MLGLDHPAGAEHKGVFDHIHQFPDIARPAVLEQHLHAASGDAGNFLAGAFADPLDKGLHQQGDVGHPFPQGREIDGNHSDPVIEVFPELPFPDQLLQILVGGGDDPHIDLDRAMVADPLDLLFLQDPQQLGLGGQGQVADFVEKDAAAAGRLEAAGPAVIRPGERPLDMSEQFAFQEIVIERGAVDLDKRSARCAG